MSNITYKSSVICLYYYLQKVCNFHMKVFQIKLKYHCSKPIRLQKFLVQQYNRKYHLKRYIIILHPVEPPLSDHPKCTQKTWSLTGGGRVQESNHMGPLPRRGPGTSTSWKIIYCMQFLSYAMCSSMLSLKVLSYIQSSTAYTVIIETTECSKWSLRRA